MYVFVRTMCVCTLESKECVVEGKECHTDVETTGMRGYVEEHQQTNKSL